MRTYVGSAVAYRLVVASQVPASFPSELVAGVGALHVAKQPNLFVCLQEFEGGGQLFWGASTPR